MSGLRLCGRAFRSFMTDEGKKEVFVISAGGINNTDSATI